MTTGLEVRLQPAAERTELRTFTRTLDELVLTLREIDHVYLARGTRATWVLAGLQNRDGQFVVQLEARPSGHRRSPEDMLVAVNALAAGVEQLQGSAEIPALFTPSAVERLGKLAKPVEGLTQVAVAPYNGTTGPAVSLSPEVHLNAVEAVRTEGISFGSVTGVLASVEVEKSDRGAKVTLLDQQSRRVVVGHGPEVLGEQFRSLWKHRVALRGAIRRNSSGQPVKIDVDQIEVLPETVDGLPLLSGILGADPKWTDGEDVDAFLDRLRHG